MTDYKVGDAVTGIDNSSVYLVVSVTDEYGILRFEGDAPSFSYLSHELQHAVTVPDWIIKWREENLPPTPTDTEESKADAQLEEELKRDIELGKKFSIGDVVQHSQGYAVISKKNPLLGMWWNEEGHRCSAVWSSLTLILTADGSSDR